MKIRYKGAKNENYMYYVNKTLYCCNGCFSITKRIMFILSKNNGRVRRTVLVFFFNSVLYYRNINFIKKKKINPLIYLNLYL